MPNFLPFFLDYPQKSHFSSIFPFFTFFTPGLFFVGLGGCKPPPSITHLLTPSCVGSFLVFIAACFFDLGFLTNIYKYKVINSNNCVKVGFYTHIYSLLYTYPKNILNALKHVVEVL